MLRSPARSKRATRARRSRSASWPTRSTLLEALIARGIVPDVLTDQTSAHDELNGYVPAGMSYDAALAMREASPDMYIELSYETMARHMRAMIELQNRGAITFDYGNNLRGQALKAGVTNAFDVGGFVPLFIRPLFCEGRDRSAGRRCRAIRTISSSRTKRSSSSSRMTRAASLDPHGAEARRVSGPAGAHLLARLRRARQGRAAVQRLVAEGKVSAPIVIGRDHLDAGSVASPNRETEAMKDGSDAIADWPILNAMLNTSCGATWVSVHHGGGVGIGYSLHAGMVIVADGTTTPRRACSAC